MKKIAYVAFFTMIVLGSIAPLSLTNAGTNYEPGVGGAVTCTPGEWDAGCHGTNDAYKRVCVVYGPGSSDGNYVCNYAQGCTGWQYHESEECKNGGVQEQPANNNNGSSNNNSNQSNNNTQSNDPAYISSPNKNKKKNATTETPKEEGGYNPNVCLATESKYAVCDGITPGTDEAIMKIGGKYCECQMTTAPACACYLKPEGYCKVDSDCEGTSACISNQCTTTIERFEAINPEFKESKSTNNATSNVNTNEIKEDTSDNLEMCPVAEFTYSLTNDAEAAKLVDLASEKYQTIVGFNY